MPSQSTTRRRAPMRKLSYGLKAAAFIVGGSLLSFTTPAAHADSWTWIGGDLDLLGGPGSNDWSASNPVFQNWSHSGSTYSSAIPVSDPNTSVTFGAAEGAMLVQDIANPFELNSLNFSSGASTYTLTGSPLTFMSNSAPATPSINQAATTLEFVQQNLILANDTAVNVGSVAELVITSNISGSAALSINGPGMLALGASNSYSGGTTINGGLTVITNSNAFGSGALTLNSGQLLAGANATIANSFSDTSSGAVNFSAVTGATLTLSGTSENITEGNNLSFGSPGNAGMIVSSLGGGQIGAAPNQGTLSVNNGELYDSSGFISAISFGFVETIAAGATLNYADGATVLSLNGAGTAIIGSDPAEVLALQGGNFSGSITGAGSVALSGNVVLSGSNNYTGSTTFNSANVGAGNNSAFSSGAIIVNSLSALYANSANVTIANPITVAAGGILSIMDGPNGAQLLTLSGAISSAAPLYKSGTGALQLTGPQFVAGGYQLSSGVTIFLGNTINLGFADIDVAKGAYAEYGGSTTVIGGFLDGAGDDVVGDNCRFIGVNIGNGVSLDQNGVCAFTNVTNGGTFYSQSALFWNGGSNSASGVFNVSSDAQINAFSNYGVINVAAGGALSDVVGNLYLAGGSRMYIGTSANPGGSVLLAGGNTLEVNGALLVNNGTISGTTDINFGSLAEGMGTYGPVNITTGGVFQPGFNPGASGTVVSSAVISALTGTGTVDNQNAGGNLNLIVNSSGFSTFSGIIQNTTGTLGLTISGTGGLTLLTQTLLGGAQSSNTYSGGTTITGGTLTIGAVGAYPAGTPVSNNGTLNILAGTSAHPVVFGNSPGSGAITGTGALNVGAVGTLAYARLQSTGSLTSVSSAVSTVESLTISRGSTLDITNNPLAINFGSPGNDPAGSVRTALASAYQGGAWTGTGLTSTSVEAQVAFAKGTSNGAWSIGYIDGAKDGAVAAANHVGATELLISPQLSADANEDGQVNFNDLVIVAQNFGSTTGDWTHGDFNYDSIVNFQDLVLLAQNLGKTNGNTLLSGELPASFEAQWDLALAEVHASGTTSVPEPASLTMVAAGALMLRRRRR